MATHPMARTVIAWARPDRRPANAAVPWGRRLAEARARQAAPADPLARPPQLALVEAVLFMADEPLTARRLAQAAVLADGTEARRLVRRLQELYEADASAFQVEELAGGYQLLTRPGFFPWLARWRRGNAELRLSPAARETLAVVAYRQPITRADVEAVRGVGCSEVLRQLMEKNLIRIAGRDSSLGRPVLYGTTKKFLQVFGLKSLKDLPRADEFRRPGSRGEPGA